MLHLFRRRRHVEPPSGTLAQHDEAGDGNPPPSYEDSQDASLRAVLQGARAVMPLLWPSTHPSSVVINHPSSPLTPTDKYQSIQPNTDPSAGKNRQHGKEIDPAPRAGDDAVIDVLADLAMVPCGGRPFLDRIRQFSDFYLAPYMGSRPADPPTQDGDASQELQLQRAALEGLDAPRESVALVLCARVLESYYVELGHLDIAADDDTPQDSSAEPKPDFQGEKHGLGETAKVWAGSDPSPSSSLSSSSSPTATTTTRTIMKTRLTQIAPCLEEEGCSCCDYDALISSQDTPHPATKADQEDDSTMTSRHHASPSPPRCCCGHPRASHSHSHSHSASASASGVSRLLRRYTNWHPAPYRALGHRSTTGSPKWRIHQIEACGARAASGADRCPCPDYDKGSRTGRCARCGHYDTAHRPIDTAPRERERDKRRRRKKDGGGPTATAAGPGAGSAEWELSWILIENAYLLLGQITPSLPSRSS
ncbi:hypothetical protein F4802DRAFT_14968 [Xylaria palmicola]|nr:hypothetical protein F4802DRAFT_14968 [Xylaria palmicola]